MFDTIGELIGNFKVRVIRDGNIIYDETHRNGIVDEAKNALLDTMFNASTQATWYCGLMATLTTLSDSDTMASHAGWTEYTSYDETTREVWNPDVAASKEIKNPSTAYCEFTIDDATNPTIPGMFICSDSTKSGSSGTLWCTSAFSTAPTPADNDVVQVQYVLTIA